MAKTTNTRFQILFKLLECSAGGGNRTIRAYSFYVTYCKHTNARTAQPAVCPPPMYKIMYNEIGRCGEDYALNGTSPWSEWSLARQLPSVHSPPRTQGLLHLHPAASAQSFRQEETDCDAPAE